MINWVKKKHILHYFFYIKKGNRDTWVATPIIPIIPFLSSEKLLQVILLKLIKYFSVFLEFSIHRISKIRKFFWGFTKIKILLKQNFKIIALSWYSTILNIMFSVGHYTP